MKTSAGTVKTKYIKLKEIVKLESGNTLSNIQIAYETYGILNKNKSNAIYVFHALSGDAHVAGYHKGDKKPGWWDFLIGPGKALDTNKYFIICSNVLGGCKGTTGPSSLHKNKKYGSAFPLITIKDMVNVQKRLVDYLGIRNLHAIIGGSMGGMQVLQFISDFPDSAKLAIPIATALKQSPQGIAFHAVGRQAIMRDPNWRKGNYYNGKNQPAHGLSIARMLSHITYMSEDSMWEKFGRKLQDKESLGYNFDVEFQIESYLNYQGESFIKRFDANTYLYITRAIDYFDITRNSSSDEMFVKTKSKCLVVSISSDWLYTTKDALEIVSALRSSNVDTSFVEIKSNFGHDAFLIENPKFEKLIKNFVDNNFEG